MADVAARAGVAKGTPYLYFPDKAALFEAVLRSVIEAPLAGLATAAPRPGEGMRDTLRRVVPPLLRDMESSRRGEVW